LNKDEQDQNCTQDDLVKGLPTFTASAPAGARPSGAGDVPKHTLESTVAFD